MSRLSTRQRRAARRRHAERSPYRGVDRTVFNTDADPLAGWKFTRGPTIVDLFSGARVVLGAPEREAKLATGDDGGRIVWERA